MKRCPNPVLDFRLMEIPTFRLSVLSGAASRLAAGSFPFLMPAMLQIDPRAARRLWEVSERLTGVTFE